MASSEPVAGAKPPEHWLPDEFMHPGDPKTGEKPMRFAEMDYAEMETRIKRYTLELVQPAISKASRVESQMHELRMELQRGTSMLSDLTLTATKVEQQMSIVEIFREEMSKWDAERRQVQAQVADSIATMKHELDTFRYSLERKEASIHSMQRTVDRAVGELGRLQAAESELRGHVEQRMGTQSRLVNGMKADLEEKLAGLETRHNRLSDEVWGGETGLMKVSNELFKTNDLVKALSEETKRMQQSKANVTQLSSMQEEVNELIRDANNSVSTLRRTMDTVVGDVKEHFRTATNTVAAHNASMLSEVRGSYQEELAQAAKVRSDIMIFMRETEQSISQLEGRVHHSQEQTTEIMGKTHNELEDLAKTRSRDKNNNDLDRKQLHAQLSGVNATSENVAKCLEHVCNVTWMMLQSERRAVAIDKQDDSDRTKVALMGYHDKDETQKKPGAKPHGKATRSRASTAASSPGHCESPAVPGSPGGGDNDGPVISLDSRCVSCSGEHKTVLAGFKMACLQYMPGPVVFAKKTYDRQDLLDQRQKLLDQASEALQQSPIAFSQKEVGFAPREAEQKELLPKVSGEDGSRLAAASPSDSAEDMPASSRSSSVAGRAVKMPPVARQGSRTHR